MVERKPDGGTAGWRTGWGPCSLDKVGTWQYEQLRHASSFGSAAAAYAERRPDYAQAAVR